MPEVEVGGALHGERIDRAVATLTGCTRAEAQRWCTDGLVKVNGFAVGKSHRLVEGELVSAPDAIPDVASVPQPDAAIELDIRYEDASLVVLAKPAGLVVHPGAGHRDQTLVNALIHRYPELEFVGSATGAVDRPGIVHRLDRDTSGLMVVARTVDAYEALVAALATRAVERRYLTLVWGLPESDRGMIDAPIGRSNRDRTRMAVARDGREARTRYEVLERFESSSYLECQLETGRTHQIRVHLAAIGHPVVGDRRYGTRGGATTNRSDGIALERPFLHAYRLGFDHPMTGSRVSIDEPLPNELIDCLEDLRSQTAEPTDLS